eukprot:scaffold92744_cov69-Phaeocystis_antarctica.AAC.1
MGYAVMQCRVDGRRGDARLARWWWCYSGCPGTLGTLSESGGLWLEGKAACLDACGFNLGTMMWQNKISKFRGDGRVRPRQRALAGASGGQAAWQTMLRDGAPPPTFRKPPPPPVPMPILTSSSGHAAARLSEPTRPSTPRCASWRVCRGSASHLGPEISAVP